MDELKKRQKQLNNLVAVIKDEPASSQTDEIRQGLAIEIREMVSRYMNYLTATGAEQLRDLNYGPRQS